MRGERVACEQVWTTKARRSSRLAAACGAPPRGSEPCAHVERRSRTGGEGDDREVAAPARGHTSLAMMVLAVQTPADLGQSASTTGRVARWPGEAGQGTRR